MLITIVDKNDLPIDTRERGKLLLDDIYRVAASWIITKDHSVLIQQRANDKKNLPGRWGCSVAGTVESHESYDENIVKETEEELGVKSINYKKSVKTFVEEDGRQFFCQWYIGIIEHQEITFCKEEIQAVAWLPLQDLIKDVQMNAEKYIPTVKDHLKVLIQGINNQN